MHGSRGHHSPPTTSVSTPLTARAAPRGAGALNRLLRDRGWERALPYSAALVPLVDAPLWHKDGVGHGALGGRGVAAWRSRSPSIFRVASSHHRLLTLPEGHVTSQDKASATAQVKPGTLPAAECMRQFLQPGRPPRCIQGRDDGMRSPTNRPGLTRARARRGAGPVEADPTGHHRHRGGFFGRPRRASFDGLRLWLGRISLATVSEQTECGNSCTMDLFVLHSLVL